MQKISQFYGVTIEMEPQQNYLSHVFALFGNQKAMFSAQSGEIMDGDFPHRESLLVKAWILLHQNEIKENWDKSLVNSGFRMKTIAPLE